MTTYIYLVNVWDHYYPSADSTVMAFTTLEEAQKYVRKLNDPEEIDQYDYVNGRNALGYEHASVFVKELRDAL